MQQQGPNRMGLGMRPMYQGQGPPIGSLPPSHALYGQHPQPQFGHGGPMEKLTTLFVGSISTGVGDAFLTDLFNACGPIRSFKRLTNPNGKPQGFGFVEFEEPDAVGRAVTLLHDVLIPALEEGFPDKRLVVRADDKTKAFLQAYETQRIKTDQDDAAIEAAKARISSLLEASKVGAVNSGDSTTEQNIIPPHLRDLQENDLPENQRGLVISEIALFRERAAKREKDKANAERDKHNIGRSAGVGGFSGAGNMSSVPSGPKERVWGRPAAVGARQPSSSHQNPPQQSGWGDGAQGYNKPVGFVKGESADQNRLAGGNEKTDEELERDRREARRREEDESFRDRERRYEPRERQRIYQLERVIMRERLATELQEKDAVEMKERLEVWDDDESDEMFYADRARWRSLRSRHLHTEMAADEKTLALEERQAEHLRIESEAFLVRQMAEMQSLAEEQRKAGLLLDDGAPVKLSISAAAPAAETKTAPVPHIQPPVAGVFGVEEEDNSAQKRKAPLVKIDFGGVEAAGREERLEKVKASVKRDKESLWKAKIRWECMSDYMVDGKMERFIKRKMTDYLGQLDDDDLVMFVVEHLKDHKPPQKLVEGLEPVLVEEAEEFAIALWRQVVFESIAYGEGLETADVMVD